MVCADVGLIVSMDDYYLDRELIPTEADGSKNYERLSALDLNLLVQHVTSLVSDVPTKLSYFSFRQQKPRETAEPITLRPNDFVVLEGINGLNPTFTAMLPQKPQTIYVSCITQLNLDRHHRVSTSDTRLIRYAVVC